MHILHLLLNLTRGGIPLLNFLLDHCLADEDMSRGEFGIDFITLSTKASLDVLGLNFESSDFVVMKKHRDINANIVRRTQNILASGCHSYQESSVAIEARLSGLTCKVRLRGKVCAQNHMPMQLSEDSFEWFFLEIEAFRKLQGGERIAEFIGVVLDDSQ